MRGHEAVIKILLERGNVNLEHPHADRNKCKSSFRIESYPYRHAR